jgi:NAD(P)H-dependent flavin oxidoreductase YrpB (nitropropane dioxygenase family)
MGVAVSNWKLAKEVAKKGKVGVVSGTAIDAVMARRLQLGDPGGHIGRAMSHFPWPDMVKRIWDRYFVLDGKPDDKPFKPVPMPSINMKRSCVEMLMVSNFVEVFLAKEGHDGTVGINYLEKIQMPTLPSIFGAMLAGANVVLMGAGIPHAIPGALDQLAKWKPAQMRIFMDGGEAQEAHAYEFDPREYCEGPLPELSRPDFLAIVSSDIIAKTLAKKASGEIDGFVVEYHRAGGHNAPPRRSRAKAANDELPGYGPMDLPNIDKIRDIGKPFWLAGGYASPEALKEAIALGARGIQVGTAFALCNESGLVEEMRHRIISEKLAGSLSIQTDFAASPTGYPFKLAYLSQRRDTDTAMDERCRVCDLGYLRRPCGTDEGGITYRCPGEPVDAFVRKGGEENETYGRQCLCNGLLAAAGLAQTRRGVTEPPILTIGEDLDFVSRIVKDGNPSFSASDVIDYLES